MFTYKISEKIVISRHAHKQMAKRAVLETEVAEIVENGEIIFDEIDERFGTKYHSCLRGLLKDLVVLWFVNKQDKKEVITVYLRRKR